MFLAAGAGSFSAASLFLRLGGAGNMADGFLEDTGAAYDAESGIFLVLGSSDNLADKYPALTWATFESDQLAAAAPAEAAPVDDDFEFYDSDEFAGVSPSVSSSGEMDEEDEATPGGVWASFSRDEEVRDLRVGINKIVLDEDETTDLAPEY